MPVSHAPVPSRAPDDAADREPVPGLLEALAQVADPRRRRGRRFSLVFTVAVAVVCVLAGARSFREIGDQAADLPQDVLAALGGVRCPLRRRIAGPSEKRIRTLLQDLDGDALDVIVGGWLRSLAAAGKPARPQDGPPGHIAIDGKCLRGVGDGPVKLFSALQHGDGAIIAWYQTSQRDALVRGQDRIRASADRPLGTAGAAVEPADQLGEGGDVTVVPVGQPFGETIPDGLRGGVQVLPPGGGQGQRVAPAARLFGVTAEQPGRDQLLELPGQGGLVQAEVRGQVGRAHPWRDVDLG